MREMKDSGVEWIGEIPQEWKMCRLKNYAYIMNGADYKDIQDDNGNYPVIGSGGEFDRATKYLYDGESVLLGRKGTIDKPRYINGTFWTVDTMYYTKIKDIGIAKYLYYLCTQIQFDYYQYGSAVPSMTQRDLNGVCFPLPEIVEQENIVHYLDVKCSKIDEIIEKQQAIIEKLKEYKLSIITEAVTKGLNPDAEMKDSGDIEIGKIPSISRPTKLKYLCNTQGRIGFKGYTTTDLVDEGEGAYTLGASHLNNGKIDLTDPVFISWEKYYESPEIMVKQNDILIVQRGSTIGKVAIVDKNYGEVTINPSLVLINKIHIDSKYLLYALSARYIANYINLIGTTTAIPMISQKQINDLVVIVPPDSIQISVVKYLDEKCSKIDTNILKKQKLIEKLQEYKKSLIYEVVTGKKEV